MLAINVYPVKPQKAKLKNYACRMRSPNFVRQIIGANLKALMKNHPHLDSQMKIQTKTKGRVSQRTVGRILEGSVSVTVDNLAELADIFGLQPWQMLLPNLDPKNPQLVPAITPAEKALYDSLKLAFENFQSDKP